MNQLDFSQVLGAALTPITLMSGVGLLLMTMSARYAHAVSWVRRLLHERDVLGGGDEELSDAISALYGRAALLRKAILYVVLSALATGLLVLACVIEAIFAPDLKDLKGLLLLTSVGCIVVGTGYFSEEVRRCLRTIGLSARH